MVEWLHLWQPSLVADENDGDIGLLDDGCHCSNTSSVTGRHAVNLIHDQDKISFPTVHLLAVSSKITLKRCCVENT
jgi:hypothetical protein